MNSNLGTFSKLLIWDSSNRFSDIFLRVTLILHRILCEIPCSSARSCPKKGSNHLSWWDLGYRLLILAMQPNVTLKWFVVGCSAIFLTHCQLEFPRSSDYGEWNVPLNCYLPPLLAHTRNLELATGYIYWVLTESVLENGGGPREMINGRLLAMSSHMVFPV